MKYTKKDTESFNILGGTNGNVFPSHPNGDHTIVYVTMDGVYPKKGDSVNDYCTETIYMLEGRFIITINDKEIILNQNEICIILPGQIYNIKGKGKSIDIITPKWNKEQNHIINI